MSYLSEQISGDETIDEIINIENGSKWKLKDSKNIAGFIIPAGTVGELLHTHLGKKILKIWFKISKTNYCRDM